MHLADLGFLQATKMLKAARLNESEDHLHELITQSHVFHFPRLVRLCGHCFAALRPKRIFYPRSCTRTSAPHREVSLNPGFGKPIVTFVSEVGGGAAGDLDQNLIRWGIQEVRVFSDGEPLFSSLLLVADRPRQ
jgi:hypothetical protein